MQTLWCKYLFGISRSKASDTGKGQHDAIFVHSHCPTVQDHVWEAPGARQGLKQHIQHSQFHSRNHPRGGDPCLGDCEQHQCPGPGGVLHVFWPYHWQHEGAGNASERLFRLPQRGHHEASCHHYVVSAWRRLQSMREEMWSISIWWCPTLLN